jgi:hypothetical protein
MLCAANSSPRGSGLSPGEVHVSEGGGVNASYPVGLRDPPYNDAIAIEIDYEPSTTNTYLYLRPRLERRKPPLVCITLLTPSIEPSTKYSAGQREMLRNTPLQSRRAVHVLESEWVARGASLERKISRS